PLLAGLCYGLALARALWETWPPTFLFFNQTPLLRWGVGGAGALACWALWRGRRVAVADFAPLFLTLVGMLAPDVNLLRLWALLIGSVTLVGALAWRRRWLERLGVSGFPEATDRGGDHVPVLVLSGASFAVYVLRLRKYV